MASKVKICNLALSRIGASRITSLTDGTVESTLCNVLYEDMAEEVMSEGSWSSTIARSALNVTTNTPAFGFSYEFQLPTVPRTLKILNINEDTVGDYDFRIEGDKLLANVSSVSVRYVSFIEDTASYDVYLKRALVSRMAAEMAYTLTGSATVAERLYARYLRDLDDGLSNNGQQGSEQLTVSPDLLKVR